MFQNTDRLMDQVLLMNGGFKGAGSTASNEAWLQRQFALVLMLTRPYVSVLALHEHEQD